MKTLLLALVSIVSFSSLAQAGSCVPRETQTVISASKACFDWPKGGYYPYVHVMVQTRIEYCNGQSQVKVENKSIRQPNEGTCNVFHQQMEKGLVVYDGPATDVSAE